MCSVPPLQARHRPCNARPHSPCLQIALPAPTQNPDFKGKWSAPLIDNPKYKGVWEPRRIPNPDYHKDETPLAHIGKVRRQLGRGLRDGLRALRAPVVHSPARARRAAGDLSPIQPARPPHSS